MKKRLCRCPRPRPTTSSRCKGGTFPFLSLTPLVLSFPDRPIYLPSVTSAVETFDGRRGTATGAAKDGSLSVEPGRAQVQWNSMAWEESWFFKQ